MDWGGWGCCMGCGVGVWYGLTGLRVKMYYTRMKCGTEG